jgi:hypothetical protein
MLILLCTFTSCMFLALALAPLFLPVKQQGQKDCAPKPGSAGGPLLLALLSALIFSSPKPLRAQTEAVHGTASHIVIVNADLEWVYGMYYFAVINPLADESPFAVDLNLPQEARDIGAGENLSEADITIDGTHVHVARSFPPGMSLAGVRFRAPAQRGKDSILTFIAAADIKQFYVATTQSDALTIQGKDFADELPPMLQGGSYSGALRRGIKQGEIVEVRIAGVPGPRTILWVVFACTALALGLGFLVAWSKERRGSE